MTPNPEVAALLNAHLKSEIDAHHLYYMASLAMNRAGFFGFEGWLKKQADSELHDLKAMIEYLNDFSLPATVPMADALDVMPLGPQDILSAALDKELTVTRELSDIAQAAFDAQDFQTYQLMLDFLKEQAESEAFILDARARLQAAQDKLAGFDHWMEEQ